MALLNQNRSKLLLGCGSAALAMGLAMAPQAASAQAIQATDTTVSGNITRTATGTGTETIQVNTQTAVVNWTPDEDGGGNALDYLPTGNQVTFRNGTAFGDFAILNRILPATNGNVVVFDGSVISQLFDTATGGLIGPGGTVAFYSPTGIFVGDNAVFDVGNLILTTLDPDLASFDDFALNGGPLQLVGQTGTTASIIINPGAQISANAENSFFAVTAAEIQMLGTSSVNGSTAFVAGEQVNVTVSNGLFDIEIPVGTSVTTPIVINGDVGGPSSTGIGDNHLIYAVAAAQNDPISLLFSGNLGFDPAASAGIVNGEIILSANYEVFGRQVANQNVDEPFFSSFIGNLETTATPGNIFVNDINASSSILAAANEEVQVTAVDGPGFIDGDLLMFGRAFSELTASNGQTFDITGSVLVSADDVGLFDIDPNPDDINTVAGQAFIDAFDGGTINIAGDVIVTADAVAGADLGTLGAGSATGGFAAIASTGGTLNIGGIASASADAIFDVEGLAIVLEGNIFTAGIAQVFATQGGQVTIDGFVVATADAVGATGDDLNPSTASTALAGQSIVQTIDDGSSLTLGDGLFISASANAGRSNETAQGGLADGGDAFLFTSNNSTINITGNVDVVADARGGENVGGQGGDALGGNAQVFLNSGGQITINGDFSADGQAFGGEGTSGGNGSGGIAGAGSSFGTLNITGNANVIAEGFGGDAASGFGGLGGTGMGGNSFIQATGSIIDVATVTIGGTANLNANGRGGTGGQGDGSVVAAGAGGEGIGGQIGTPNQANTNFGSGAYLLAGGDNGNLTVTGASSVTAFGIGGQGGDGGLGQDGGDGGNGTGGTAQAGLALLGFDGSVGAGTANFGDVTVFANGDGGLGGNGLGTGALPGNGGDGLGFGAFFTARAGSLTAGIVSVNADGTGGQGHVGGVGTGGSASAQFSDGATVLLSELNLFALGRGGLGDNQGGNAIGGGGDMALDDADVTITNDVLIDAGALGGFVSDGPGGSAQGGNASITLGDDAALLAIGGDTSLRTVASAADSTTTGPGASATGGETRVTINGLGTANFGGILSLDASALAGGNFDGAGGVATGGLAEAGINLGGIINVGGNFSAVASAQGGFGSFGGNAIGGSAGALIVNGSMDVTGSAGANSSGDGGNASEGFGGDGGLGQGGRATLQATGSLTETASLSIGTTATVLANGIGGSGGLGDGGSIAAGNGGDGFAGMVDPQNLRGAFLLAGGDNGTLTVGGTSFVNAVGQGGQGGNGGLGQAGGDGGNGTGGTATAGVILVGTDGSVGAGSASFGDLSVLAGANGGDGGFGGSTGDPRGNGGSATGHRALVGAQAGDLSAGNVVATSTAVGGEGANGGDATGGERAGLFTSSNGSYTVASYSGFANGFGGEGLSGLGGTGQGGQAFVGFQDGTGAINGDATVEANGTGGNSAGGDGANGTGGSANISIFNTIIGSGTISGNASVHANGFGGAGGTGFVGGTGAGGAAFVQAQAGGTINFNTLQVSAGGRGGSGPDSTGGNGIGGNADILSSDSGSQIIVQNEATTGNAVTQGFSLLAANGIGGSTNGGSGIGGTGTGGQATISATNGGAITLSPGASSGNRVTARGLGAGSAVDGGTGGSAIGGTAVIEADGGTIDAGRMLVSVVGFGGPTTQPNLNINGGDGIGGSRQISVTNGGELTVELFGGTSGSFGGEASGTGNGGNASGGSTTLTVNDGTANFVGRSLLLTQNLGGFGATGGSATGGTTSVVVTGGTVNILPNASGEAELAIVSQSIGEQGLDQGGNATAGDVDVLFSEATLNGGTLTVLATGRGGNATGPGGIGGSGTGGNVFVVGTIADIDLTGQMLIAAEGFGGNGETGGDGLGGVASLDILDTNLNVGPDANLLSEILIESSGNAGEGTNRMGNATGGLSQLLMLNANITADNLFLSSEAEAQAVATGALGGDAQGGEIEAIIEGNSTFSVNNFALAAPGTSSSEGTAAGGFVGLSIGGPSGAPDLIAAIVDINVNAEGGGDDGGPNNTAGQFVVDISSGQLRADTLFAGAQGDDGRPAFGVSSISAIGGSLLIVESMDIGVTDDFDIEFGQGGVIGGPDVLNPTASIDIGSGGTISIVGDDDNVIGFGGQSMFLASRDIDVEDGARFGAVDLTLLSINTDNPAIIGGNSGSNSPGPGEGYVLSQEEAGRIEAGTFTFIQDLLDSAGPNDPDIIIRDITAFGSLDDGVSRIRIGTGFDEPGGIIRVEGVVVYDDAALTDEFGLFADGGRIEVVTPGGIGIVDSSGNPSGILNLNADDIWVGNADLITQLQADRAFTGRDDELAVAFAGSDDPLGYLRANDVNLTVGFSLLVRNTGTATEQGGILVGDGGLSIEGGQNTENGLDVFAYGARIDSSGNLITGEAFFQEVNFNNDGSSTGSSNYTGTSEFNDCLINTGECGEQTGGGGGEEPVEPGPPTEEAAAPVVEVINNPTTVEAAIATVQTVETTEQESNDDFGIDFPGLVEAEDIEEEGDIEDPVASGGDSSLYGQGGNVEVEGN